MNTIIGSTITVYDPSNALLAWCNKNLVVANPDYEKKQRLGFWLGNTPRLLYLYEKVANSIILPYGTLRDVWPFIKNDPVDRDFPEPEDVDYGNTNIPLYDYQQEAVQACFDAKYGILQSPAGSGKTQMGVALIKAYERRALWLTHTVDLLKQSYDRAAMYMDRSLFGTITAGKVSIGTGITFATVQTLSSIDLDKYANVWDVVIVDECHRVAGSPTKMTMFYKVLNKLNARHKFGLSATIHRSDGLIQCTYAMLGKVVHEITQETVASKIMHVGVKACFTGVPQSDMCVNTDGTLNYSGLVTYLSRHTRRNQQIAADIVQERDHPCLVLSDRLEHLQELMHLLPFDMIKQAGMITGKMVTKADRQKRMQILDDMRDGRLKYLFATYSLAKEGLDIPRLERLFMASPVKDETVVIQAIGRIARVYPGKADPIVYDYVDAIPYCKTAYRARTRHYDQIGATYVP